jgi:acyl carrier protein|tara:strand:- start:1815 stop:2051 length:237 start_codon:yes stop_codon:yes gene_type:complete
MTLNEKQLISVISKSIKTKINIKSNTLNTEKWDSIGHLQILASLDKVTKGAISKINRIADANSVKEIISILKKNKLFK